MNTVSSEKRKYTLGVRSDRQGETRRRILEATASLHREVGPARTTVAEIARRAGVQRLTVYTHFPDDFELISACQAHFFDENPAPRLDDALSEPEPPARIGGVLTRMYAWYRASERDFATVLQDRGTVPALDRVLQFAMDEPQAQLADALAAGFSLAEAERAAVTAMILLALDFWSWKRLSGQQLDDAAISTMMTTAIVAIANSSG
jgi:AcrR family transcriptional regulator